MNNTYLIISKYIKIYLKKFLLIVIYKKIENSLKTRGELNKMNDRNQILEKEIELFKDLE